MVVPQERDTAQLRLFALCALGLTDTHLATTPRHTPPHHARYLRPGDSLPVGIPDHEVQPLALPAGWREKYAGGWVGHQARSR